MWRDGLFEELMFEFERCCSVGSRKQKKRDVDERERINRIFTRLMLLGQVKAAMQWLTEQPSGGVLKYNDVLDERGTTVLDVLKSKHPDPRKEVDETYLDETSLPPLIEIDITSSHIEKVVRRIQGNAGPSGTDALQWQNFLLRQGKVSEQLGEAVAALARRIANTVVDWEEIQALMASRLIALDKNPGVRPIAIGEVLRRIISKAVAMVTRSDIESICQADQLCSGVGAGIEAAIHCVRELFEDMANDGCGLLLVDAKNAFNSVNRCASLWNARILWPRGARYLFNTYRGFSKLWISGSSEFLFSKEGVSQGDPLSMLMYAMAVLPLIRRLSDRGRRIQNYADNASCFGSLQSLREWLISLMEVGPKYGYCPEP